MDNKKNISLSFISLFIFFISLSLSKSGEVTHQMTQLDSPPDDIKYCGPNQEVIFVLTEGSIVYQSKDKGKTWTNLIERLKSEAKNTRKKENENEAEIGAVIEMIKSPVDPSLLIFIGSQSFAWIVENCGEKISASLLGRPLSKWICHPTERNWAIVSANSLCDDYYGDEPCRIVKEIFVTQTLGDDWKKLGEYVGQFDWGIINENHIKAGIPKERILMSYQPGARGNQTIFGNVGNFFHKYSYKFDLVYSDDFFKTKKIAARKGNNFLLTPNDLYVSQVIDEENQDVILLHANSNQATYKFSKIVTNQEIYSQHSFHFLYYSGVMSFLFINNLSRKAKFGNVYASDAEGKKFSLSLKNNIQVIDNLNDFEAVISVEGVYVANVISGKYIKLANQELQKRAQENSNSMSQDSTKKENINIKKEQKSTLNFLNYAKTLITFNNGGDWKRIPAPEQDSLGKSYNCGEYCYLHLYSYSSKKPRFYAVDNAVGIIIGNGNVGRYMDYTYQNVALFLSRDGGNNWFEIKKGTYTYEIGDHGGLIVIAQYDTPTKYISYTYDEGISWDELKISDEEFRIKNILNDPSSSKQNFLVYGIKQSNEGEPQGIIINLDFSSLKIPTCSRSDYETWIPRSGTDKDMSRNCILGKSTTYQRRKRESKCVNGENFIMSLRTEKCQCTDDDYQCDVGYHRDEPGEQCIPISNKTQEELYKPPEDCKGYYKVSRGYRIIPGNVCTGLKKYDPILVACPYNKVFYGMKILFFVAVIFAILFIGYGIYNFTNIELKDIIDVVRSLMPSIDFSFGGSSKYKSNNNYSGLDLNDDDEENNGFYLDTNIGSNSKSGKNKKSKKNVKKKKEKETSGKVIVETQKGTSDNPPLI